eukprot:CAMPEP_0184702906 /NCGR_PEP_ID=MMETSP0313-20130426/25915_1 /TAXON_ID=2792 /ORGANISM="Porphyridium aerugineum, Strain SAG 1380-2" /LENGTH=64 /DNA_ID=CAMNT_0027163525 /DNA_START=186 /DNA_END=376 /DNA_ORIENTATION=+
MVKGRKPVFDEEDYKVLSDARAMKLTLNDSKTCIFCRRRFSRSHACRNHMKTSCLVRKACLSTG